MNPLISPYLTEKSAAQIDAGLYVFLVTPSANKTSIAESIEKLYKVHPVSVRIVNLPAKQVTFKRTKGTQPVRRKAYIQLKPKELIPGFESLKADNKENKKEEAVKTVAPKATKESK